MKHKIVTNASCIVMAALSLSSAATDYHVYPDEREGLTGPQQFVDCIHKISAGDTIIVAPGTYDFTGIYDSDSTDGGRSHVSRAAAPISSFSVIGDTSGHWDDAVVFKGDVRFGCFSQTAYATQYKGAAPYFANITFDGFAAEASDSNGNSGGAIKFALPTQVGQWGWPTVTNCVFKNNSSPGQGTVIFGAVKVYDCKFVDNTYVDGSAGSAVVVGHGGIYGCLFERNSSTGNAGAVKHNSYPISNCTFIANACRNFGGAIYGDGNSLGEIVNCHFLTNSAFYKGGAICFSNKGSPLVTNCTFSGNIAYNPSRGSTAGGAVCNDCSSDSSIGGYVNCTFTGNKAFRANGGAAYGGLFRNCAFDSNYVTNNPGGAVYFELAAGGVYNCTFTNNMSDLNYYQGLGGAVYCKSGFTRPIVGSKFYGNSAYGAGAVYGGACTNCVFKDNSATADGGAINGCSAYSCTFEGSRCTQDWTPGWDARSSRLEKCDLRTGGVAGCSLNGCTIRAESGSAHGLFYLNGSLLIAATNCLITGICTNSLKGIIYAYATPGSTSTFVNCTFADITYRNADALLYGRADTITSVPIEFKNCIFSNIRKADGTGEDLSYRYVNSGVSFQNCSYGSMQDGFNLVDAGGTFQCDNPRFAEEGSHQLRHNSPLRGKGALLGWTAADTDLAGNPRIRDGKVDLGCYQCWTNPNSFIIVVR